MIDNSEIFVFSDFSLHMVRTAQQCNSTEQWREKTENDHCIRPRPGVLLKIELCIL